MNPQEVQFNRGMYKTGIQNQREQHCGGRRDCAHTDHLAFHTAVAGRAVVQRRGFWSRIDGLHEPLP